MLDLADGDPPFGVLDPDHLVDDLCEVARAPAKAADLRLQPVAPVGRGQVLRQVHAIEDVGDGAQPVDHVAAGPYHFAIVGVPGVDAWPDAIGGAVLVAPAGTRACADILHDGFAEGSARRPQIVGGVTERLERLRAQRPPRGSGQAVHGAATCRGIPHGASQGQQILTSRFLAQRVGGRVLEVVGLVEHEPFGTVEPLVPGDEQGVVQDADVRGAQAVACPPDEVAPVESTLRRSERSRTRQPET